LPSGGQFSAAVDTDWVERLRAAPPIAPVQGIVTLAEALDITGFEVYEGYLDEELDHRQSQATARRRG
jgi:hypothetical protein